MVRAALAASFAVIAAATSLAPDCQAKADAYCNQGCYPQIAGRGCDGPMVARHSGPSSATDGVAWRCYSPSTLAADNETFDSGSCYCSRANDLTSIVNDCQWPKQLSPVAQARADTYCAQDCLPQVESRGCDGPMYARHSGSWRCYSPSTLESDNATYKSGDCFCTRDAELQSLVDNFQTGTARVFAAGARGISCFRIPAVVQTKSGALVAFAEARHGGCGDGQVKEIAVSRSLDNGETWSALGFAVIAPTSNGNVGNPMPIALSDGRVALTYVYRNDGGAGVGSGNAIVFSSDDGLTWSPPQDISDGFGPAKGSMPGPDHGVQLKDSGRILIASHYGAYVDDYVHYSDDLGATWTTIEQKFPKMDEVTLADLGGGEVLMNFRHTEEPSRGRGVARSQDGGLTWSDISYDAALEGPVCEGSLAAIGGSVYFSNPASTSGRDHITVKRSDDGGRTWPSSWLVQVGGSAGYSSLVQGALGDNGTGGILFESSSSGCIDFKTFPLNMGLAETVV